MRVFVAGHKGFAGRHTVECLVAAGHEVVTTDNDLRDPIEIRGEVSAVINLAARADVSEFIARPVTAVNNNIDLTMSLLEWARTQPLTHFIQVSTNEIYGPSPSGGEPREWAPIAPSTPYSASKVAQEALACAWWRTYDVPVVITNTMHLFGEHQPLRRFIPTAVRLLLTGQPVPIYARKITPIHYAPSVRRWLHAADHADALRWLLDRPVSTAAEETRPDRWHIAGPEVNLRSLVEKIGAILGVPAEVKVMEDSTARPGHEYRYALDPAKIHRAGWKPPLGFEDALTRTVNWIKDQ